MSQRLPLTGLITALAVIFIIAASAAAVSILGAVSQIVQPTSLPAIQDAAQVPIPSFAAEVEARVKTADPSKGPALYSQYGCASCHDVDNSTGPYVVGTGARAATRRPGYSAAAYIYESIIEPMAFTVPGYPAGVMPQNFKAKIPEADLYTVIAWLLKQ